MGCLGVWFNPYPLKGNKANLIKLVKVIII